MPSCRAPRDERFVPEGEHGVLSVRRIAAPADGAKPGTTIIHVHAIEAPLTDVLFEVARVLGVNASMDPAFARVPVTLHVEHATVDEVFKQAVKHLFRVSGRVGFEPRAMWTDGGLHIGMAGPHFDMERQGTRSIPLPSAQAARDLQPWVCEQLLSTEGEVWVHGAALLVLDYRSKVDEIEAFIATLPSWPSSPSSPSSPLLAGASCHADSGIVRSKGAVATTTTLRVKALDAAAGRDTRVELEAHDVRTVDVVIALAAAAGFDATIDKRLIDAPVSLRLVDMPARVALDRVLDNDHRAHERYESTFTPHMTWTGQRVHIQKKTHAEMYPHAYEHFDEDDTSPQPDPHTALHGRVTFKSAQEARELLPVVCRFYLEEEGYASVYGSSLLLHDLPRGIEGAELFAQYLHGDLQPPAP